MGPRPGRIPPVTSTQPAHPPLEAVCQRLSYRVFGEPANSCEWIQIISNELNFPCQLFAEVQIGCMCCFEKWGFLSEKDNGIAGCDLSQCMFSWHYLLSEPFPSMCIKKSGFLVKSDWRACTCPGCLFILQIKTGISYFLILSDCTDLLNKSLPCSYLTSRFPNLWGEGTGSFFNEIYGKKANEWIPVTMSLITNADK